MSPSPLPPTAHAELAESASASARALPLPTAWLGTFVHVAARAGVALAAQAAATAIAVGKMTRGCLMARSTRARRPGFALLRAHVRGLNRRAGAQNRRPANTASSRSQVVRHIRRGPTGVAARGHPY